MTRLEIVGRHVELPMVPGSAEGSIRNIRTVDFVYRLNLAAHIAQHGQLAVSASKYRIRVGDGVAIRVADGELHRDGTSALPLIDAGAVTVDWRQDNASGRPGAEAVTNR